MLDACGRLDQSGFYDGNLASFGNFDECLEIEVEKQSDAKSAAFRGQYVMLTIQSDFVPKVPYIWDEDENIGIKKPTRHGHLGYDFYPKNYLNNDLSLAFYLGKAHLGLCIPSTCVVPTFQKSIEKVFQTSSLAKIFPNAKISVNVTSYKSGTKDFSHGDILAIFILCLLLFLCLIGTLNETCLNGQEKQFLDDFLLCFSIKNNLKKFMDTEESKCIQGLMVFSLFWIILGQTFWTIREFPTSNIFDLLDVYSDTSMMFILSWHLALDTLILIMGFGLSYSSFSQNGPINPFVLYLKTYGHVTPTYAITVLISSTLLLHWGNGPFWNQLEKQAENCYHFSWQNFLYMNNFFAKNHCFPTSWFLAANFQMLLFGAWIVFVMKKLQKRGGIYYALIPLLMLSILIPAALTGVKNWPPENFAFPSNQKWVHGFYVMFYTRFTPYIIGLGLGYLVQKTDGQKLKILTSKVSLLKNHLLKNSQRLLLHRFLFCLVGQLPFLLL